MRFATAVLLALALCSCGGGRSCPRWPEGGVRGGLTLSYSGYGTARACESSGNWQWELSPQAATGPSITHAALARAPAPAGDLTVSVRVRTPHRLRHGRPNPWEVGWLIWRYTDDRHFYYLVLKQNGFELGKEDPAYPGDQRFLITGDRPRFDVTAEHTVRVVQRGAVITATADGHRLGAFQDLERPYRSGDVGLYTEDAVAVFTGLHVSGAT